MFELITSGSTVKTRRLISHDKLTVADFDQVAEQLGTAITEARKIGAVAARQATANETIETIWNGKESQIEVYPGRLGGRQFGP